ncbi:MAG: DNA polymerase III subunit gamma/tau [Actinomycetota bacterium]|nr:DNA polymerase III subunit gamma/tau [Actinomycetota bacterium]
MAHQSLYRTYRPQTFSDVVGQSHITRTLRNAVAEDVVAHAYLFTGPRGTGKTTTARILAKALECEKGPTPDPDVTCQQCVDIAEGRHPDVYELDAASRTGVDNVREEIIGRLAYAPTRGRWKIYIIDEVHMLSSGAFNALLKSIEEPPSHTVFVLCTTHPHKVPETIQSRCQRFDFHRIGVGDIADRLALIADKEGISVAEGALALVAKHAMGGMRDAISTLEQLSTFTGKNISLADVEGLLGEVDTALLVELADIVAARDIAGAFRFVAGLAETGADMTEFVREFTGHARDLFIIAAVGDATGIVDTTPDQLARFTAQSRALGEQRLSRILDILGELGAEMRWASDSRLALEVALTRMARPQGDLTLEALAERIEALETGAPATAAAVSPAAVAATAPEPASSAPAAAAVVAPTPEQPEAEDAMSPASAAVPVDAEEPVIVEAVLSGPLDRAQVKRAWPAVLAEMRKTKKARATFFGATEIDVDPDGSTVVVEFPADNAFVMKQAGEAETRQLLRRALAAVLGVAPPIRYQLGRGAVRTIPAERGEARAHVVSPADVESQAGSRSPGQDSGSGDIDQMMTELGAEMVAEHRHDDVERTDE